MKVFSVYAPPESGRSPADEAVRMAFVKDGFAWPALFVPVLWLLWHRLWLVLVGWLALAVAIVVITNTVEWAEPFGLPAALLFAFWFAFEANNLRRWTLERRGWRFTGIATGRNRVECEQRFFARWLEAAPAAATAPSPVIRPPVRRGSSGEEPVIGLFPRAD